MGFKVLTANNVVILMVALWTMMSSSSALIACPPDACDSIQCSEIKEEDCPSKLGYIKPDGGLCGCCPKCITFIGENDSCLHLIGFPPSSECGPGLICKDSKCQKLSLDNGLHN